jgi:hypothetical protein
MQTVMFLPGALGAAEFWHPVGNLLPNEWKKVYLAWPGRAWGRKTLIDPFKASTISCGWSNRG